ncbi:MAG: ChbG/HpnK family deacetylase [Candidatus Omnitrophica bacterium]|nr:ChbG/HpnK family deacetylase [Candidatus Omnitrophota bacterium]
MEKKLVINADDFGLAPDINRGVIKCFKEGAVTDMSLLAAGASFEHAAGLAREHNINALGVHLALTCSFKPVSPEKDVPTLLGTNSVFPKNYKTFLTKYFAGLVKGEEISREFANQIARIKKEGFKITHVDSHQHVHMVPGILKILMKLAKDENIEYVRFPFEKIGFLKKLSAPPIWARNILLSSMCRLSKKSLDLAGIKHNNYFIGHASSHRLKERELDLIIAGLKEGLTEFACHPGYLTGDIRKKHPSHRNSEEELKILCGENFLKKINKQSIKLAPY